MKRILLLFLIFKAITIQSQDFTINGKINDSTSNIPLVGANIIVSAIDDSTNSKYTISSADGSFIIKSLTPSKYSIKVSFVGFTSYNSQFEITNTNLELGDIFIKQSSEELKEFSITDQVPMATIKGDTVQFNADAFKTNPDATAEDLVKKMPGIVIDDDKIQAQGEDVKKVLVDGRPFFGEDPSLALKTLPAEVIEKIEVFDQLSEQSQFTGFDDGNTTKTMNIVTRPETRNGKFGRFFAGYGSDERYLIGGNINFFNNNQRISIVGLSNNVNQQNFAQQDLLGVMSSGGGRGRRGPGGGVGGRPGGGSGGNTSNFMVGPQNGNTKTHSIGINYSDKWGEKIEVSGSYFFNYMKTQTDESLLREYILPGDSNQFYDELTISNTENYNNRLNFRFDYKIDDKNSILIRPKISFQTNKYSSLTNGLTYIDSQNQLNKSDNEYDDKSSGYNIDNDILYRRSFEKKGRTISFNLGNSFNNNSSESNSKAITEYFYGPSTLDDTLNQYSDSKNNGYGISGNLIYTEPLGQKAQLQISYRSSYSKSKADKKTYNYNYLNQEYSIFDTTYSNKFNNDYFTNRFGTGLRYNTRKMFLMANLSYQRADLVNDQTFPQEADLNQTFHNILPSAMMRVKFSRTKTLMTFYRSNTNAPSITQLQNVVDNSDPINLSVGNPELKQEYSNVLMTRYQSMDIKKSRFFFVMFMLRNTQNKIVNSTIIANRDSMNINGFILNKGAQLTKPVNIDGYWNARTFITYGIPVNKIKTNINLNTGVTYTHTPGLINEVKNFSNTWNLSQGIVFASNISEKIDYTLSYNGAYNIVKNTIQEELDNNYYYQNLGLKLTWILPKGFVISNDLTHKLYSGLSDDYSENYLLWSAYIGKKFLKGQNLEIKLSAFDILDQNKSIKRSVTESYIEDSWTEVLKRYFMLTLTFNLKNFLPDEQKQNDFRPPFGRPGRPPGGRM
ncbi:outer membrane beta-barrel protein [Bacteroidota bacterium]